MQVVGVGGFPDQNVEAACQLLGGLFDGRAFVFGLHPRRGVGVKAVTAQGGRVAVSGPTGKGGDLRQHVRVAVDHTGKIHQFGQPVDRSLGQQRRQIGCVQGCAAGLHRCGGHSRGSHHRHPQRQSPAAFGHKAHTVQPGHIGNFVGVDYSAGHATGQQCGCELRRGAETAFDVDVGVDQPWADVCAVQIDGLAGTVARPDPGDALAVDGNVGLFDCAGEQIQ